MLNRLVGVAVKLERAAPIATISIVQSGDSVAFIYKDGRTIQ